jgi:hypothetical protein
LNKNLRKEKTIYEKAALNVKIYAKCLSTLNVNDINVVSRVKL